MKRPRLGKFGKGYLVYLTLLASHLLCFLVGFWTCYQLSLKMIAELVR